MQCNTKEIQAPQTLKKRIPGRCGQRKLPNEGFVRDESWAGVELIPQITRILKSEGDSDERGGEGDNGGKW